MKVNEIFRSIQGESSYAGLPCVFIRLTGCNLRCTYCDTKYAYDEGKNMSVKQVVKEIKKILKPGDLIEFTGGEPMLQQDEIKEVIKKLNYYNILIETNGSILMPKLIDRRTDWEHSKFIMDWKSISSGMSDRMKSINLDRLSYDDELKFVIETDEDYEQMKDVLKKYKPVCKILVSTVFGVDKKHFVNKILEDKLNVRFQVQLHKIVWEPTKRGV